MKKLWIISVVFTFALMTFVGSSESSGLSHIKTNITVYLNNRLQAPEMKAWIDPRPTSIKTSATTPYNFTTKQYFYLDVYVLSSFGQATEYVDYLKANGWVYEPTFVHAKTDYTSANANLTWLQSDKFDRFENANGVMRTADDIVYTDLTATAYSGSVTWQNIMYIGYELPFDQVNLIISASGNGIVRTWEYWNGVTWSTLLVKDGTNTFASSGQVGFTPPSDWAIKVINGSRRKYFVRCRITAATTSPVTSAVKGDTWLNGSVQAARGWNASDANIVNAGTELEYNPTPPAGSSAKFPYQARITAWSNNHFIMNPGNVQGGVRPWSQYVASVFKTKHALGFESFGDDMGGGYPLSANNDFVGTATDWDTQMKAHINEFVTSYHATYPNGIIGGNYYTTSRFPYTDFAYLEATSIASRPGSNLPYATNLNYDNFDPSIIPYNPPDARVGSNLPPKFGVIIQTDLYDDLWPQFHVNVQWDRSNRGPMTALAKHYILQNDNTVFEYQTQTGFIYDHIDAVFYLDPTKRANLTSALTADAVMKTITHSGTTATAVTVTPHGWSTGDSIKITDANPLEYNGIFSITVVNPTTFTYTMLSTPTTDATFAGQQYKSSRNIYGTDFSQFPSGTINIKIDDEVLRCSKVNNTTLLLTKPIYSLHNVGSTIRFSEIKYQAQGGSYRIKDVHYWAKWFPAIETNVGLPDLNGYNAGVRNLTWITGPTCGNGRADVWRRDYTNAIILLRTAHPYGGMSNNPILCDQNDWRTPIDLGGTYYSLAADGTTGPAITTISLRAGEGAILMKSPLTGSPTTSPLPPAPKQLSPPMNLQIVP